MEYATRWQHVDAAETEHAFGIRFRDIDESLTDTLRWLVREGHLKREQIGKLARGIKRNFRKPEWLDEIPTEELEKGLFSPRE